ncbi:hypothetical protein GCM10017783_20820 [Deinococcus piscis]|uniref:Intracellular proteinase inhibitor BsuPI domain-containing protein n=1 Tax=Deinococcus piscis TaxID=394230 RepID=A0ABQ3K8V6_9DEIO|nr:hypothetical protein [Deinococcus piscis]GHG08078.1 hypothetical protein GCM10017783_20820 [Deinococcus piscis]
MLKILLSCLALVLPSLALAQVAAGVRVSCAPATDCWGGTNQAMLPARDVALPLATPKLQPQASTSALLRAEPPARVEAVRGQSLTLSVPLQNLTAKAAEVIWGPSSYDYELLNAAGQSIPFTGGRLFPAVAYLTRCPAQALCQPAFQLNIPFDQASWGTLRPGDYTLRVALHDFWMDKQTHDLGTLDITLTLR